MGMWTDIENRVVYITRPTFVKTRKTKGWAKEYSPEEEENGDSIVDMAVRFGLSATKSVNGRTKLKGGDGRFWKIVELGIGEKIPVFKDKVKGWKQKPKHAKRVKSSKSRFQGYSSVNLDNAWLMSGKRKAGDVEVNSVLDKIIK
jgi:hypothetical protein